MQKLIKCLKKALPVALAWSAITGFGVTQAAAEPNWPSRPIELVIPQGPGGGTDVLGRLWAKSVSGYLGQSVVAVNKPGANGIVATNYVNQKKPDGYTFLLTGVSYLTINPHMYKSLAYDPKKDFDGVALLANTPFVLTASNATGIKNFEQFVQAAKAAKQPMTFASAGKGNSTHLVMEMLNDRLGLNMLHVPYTGGKLALSVISGEVDFAANVMNSIKAAAKNGDAMALAIIGPSRSDNLPGVPTLQELGIENFPMPGWYALVAPKGTPQDVINRVNEATQKFFADPEAAAILRSMDMEPLPGDASMVGKWMDRDSVVWGELIKSKNLAE